MNPPLHNSFAVHFSYPVHFTRGLFAADTELLGEVLSRDGSPRRRKVLVVVDEGLARAFPDYPARIESWFAARADRFELVRPPEIMPGGEALKNDYRRLMSLVDQMLAYRLCRHSFVVAAGGGALLDAVGFAAGLVHRGLRLLRLPSTTLAQNDAGIGVKNGMNLHGGKNTVGMFAPPWAVINDLDLLDGLSDADWRAGISEAFKVAMIKDADFFAELLRLSPALGQRDPAAMERLVRRCAELHLAHIAGSGDPFESGSARPLDFGHWSAHQLESMSHYRISHGHAVAVGIALDVFYAERLGWIPPGTADRTLRALRECGFDLAPTELFQTGGDGRPRILDGLEAFREHLGGELTLALPGPLGAVRELHEVNADWVTEHLARLRDGVCV